MATSLGHTPAIRRSSYEQLLEQMSPDQPTEAHGDDAQQTPATADAPTATSATATATVTATAEITPTPSNLTAPASAAPSTTTPAVDAAPPQAAQMSYAALEQQRILEWHQREKAREAEREKRFKSDRELYGLPEFHKMLADAQPNWDAYWTDVQKAVEYLTDFSQKSDATPPISENAEASMLATFAGQQPGLSASFTSIASNGSNGSSTSNSNAPSARASMYSDLNYPLGRDSTTSSHSSLASAVSASEATPPSSSGFLAPATAAATSTVGRRHNSRSSVNSLTSTIFATIGVHSANTADGFKPRYTLSEMQSRFQSIYPEYWTFLNETHKFSGHMHDFYDTLFMYGFRTTERTGSGGFREQRNAHMNMDRYMIDPKEFGRAVCVYLRQQRKLFHTRTLWHDGRRPARSPNSFAQKEIFNQVKSDRCVHVLNLGDIHGCFGALLNFLAGLADQRLLDDQWRLLSPDVCVVLTGDLADRGFFGVEVWLAVLYLLIRNPNQVFVLKANHEYGAENEFRHDECPLKLRLSPKIFQHIFYRIAETFPDLLFLGIKSANEINYFVYTHGAVEPGYVPNGFLAASPKTRFHLIESYDRTWFFDHLSRTDPALWKRVQGARYFSEIPQVIVSQPDGAFGGGPIWNCYQNQSDYELGRMGQGIAISKDVLIATFGFWATDTEEDLIMPQSGGASGGTLVAAAQRTVTVNGSSSSSSRPGIPFFGAPGSQPSIITTPPPPESSASTPASASASATTSTSAKTDDDAEFEAFLANSGLNGAASKGGSMRDKRSSRIKVGFGSLRKTLRMSLDPKEIEAMEAAAAAAEAPAAPALTTAAAADAASKGAKDKESSSSSSWFGKLFRRKKDEPEQQAQAEPEGSSSARARRPNTISRVGTTFRHRKGCKTPVFHLNIGGHEHGAGLEIDPLAIAREAGGYAPFWRVNPDSRKFYVYKFFNMQDLLYYKLNDVSYGRLSLQVSQDKVGWSMEGDPIQDVLGLYESSIRCRSLFNSKYGDDVFGEEKSM
ncbi:hypothetical protein CAOG_08254 [Capsaspora owczarzaki ATCC 30864]|uniref:Calcineurin-like phosphoesterase domain-containing protein n=1 Tax=Capsaspora owczarzaki (strain ATCC 30864) TaxID=595528 RepID=A0A0D2X5R4_CAPO3|nr:hypothetical protein CAOG_08254 [Capsaspora owczarzaki ATCC 30864]KJE98264.1 hypothetical protein CAOG_008254 [Capsaspora owczarzaki ATCC 30864]|eukprot:XP_004342423.1 hypothetical protein CAOG_08254 [Capsaspora owczarzaki ATCC 30864]